MITAAMSPIHGLLFDFGGTIDTNGQHWGKMLWQMYQKVGVPVCEDDFRKAYVYGERMLEKSPLVKPTDTLRRTIEVKLRLELEQLMGSWHGSRGNTPLSVVCWMVLQVDYGLWASMWHLPYGCNTS